MVAVGTTSVRALEGVAELCGRVQPYTGWTDIFLYPGRGFRVTDAVLTNFHLPESSLLMLISGLYRAQARAGRLCRGRGPGVQVFFIRGRHADPLTRIAVASQGAYMSRVVFLEDRCKGLPALR